MSTNVVRAPQTTEIGARLRICVAIGLAALALVAAVLVFSSDDSPTVSGAAVRTGGGPNEAATAGAVGRGSAQAYEAPSGIRSDPRDGSVERPEPNLLPK
jgi:hypothetical protein